MVAQPAADIGDVLPPTSEQLSASFVAIFGQSSEDLRKCQLLHVNRDAYVALLQERASYNATYANARVDQTAISSMPISGVPAQILDCACPVPGADRYQSTRIGPGSIRDPLDLAADQDNASDELSDVDPGEECAADGNNNEADSAEQPDQTNHCETPLGLDPTATPSYVQHFAAFQTQLNLVNDAFRAKVRVESRETQDDPDSAVKAATAVAAASEDCHRALIDLRHAAQDLGKHSFEDKAKVLDGVDKGLFVPTKDPLSMFNPTTWTKCFTEFWYGDALPNMPGRSRKITFEQLFAALPDREELEYQLDSDTAPYRSKTQSRFDNPENVLVFGDTLRRLLMFRGTRMAFKRRGFQKDVKAIAAATAEMVYTAMDKITGHANAEALANNEHVPKELQTALRQMLISTKDVPFTDGYKRSHRHEGHNLNVTYGSLVVFATFNFADTYSPVLFRLLDGEDDSIGDIQFKLADDAPTMPTLRKMHQLIAQSPRAQAKFFLLMDDIADIYLMGIDHSFIGRHHVQQSFHQSRREDNFASTAVPSLGGYGIAELEPFESQARGFEHGHRKKYAIPKTREREVIQLFKEEDEAALHGLLNALKTALLRCAETVQYEASTLPASQMGQSVLPEKFTKKQQTQSRLDGGVELDGTTRPLLATTQQELPGHLVLEQRAAAAESRQPFALYSQVSLRGCHQSLMPSYRLPQKTCQIHPLDEVGMVCSPPAAAPNAELNSLLLPSWTIDQERLYVTGFEPQGSEDPATYAALISDATPKTILTIKTCNPTSVSKTPLNDNIDILGFWRFGPCRF